MTILGIRPDIIRLSMIIPLLDEKFDHILVHSGQHYDPEMDSMFFEELGVRLPDHNMGVGKALTGSAATYYNQIGLLFQKTYEAIQKFKPDIIMYLGDTNTVVSSFIAAREGVPIIHVEGGMRNFDWRTPEEKNRTVIDHLADFIYSYLPHHRDNLLAEGIPSYRSVAIGNVIVDVINKYTETMTYSQGDYIFSTIHREENTKDMSKFRRILDSLEYIGNKYHPVLLPLIPSAKNRISKFGEFWKIWKHIDFIKPLPFKGCLKMQKEAKYVITDSGTLQEESCILGTPCMVVRGSTERSETIECGATVLSDPNDSSIFEDFHKLQDIKRNSWVSPLGDGKSSKRLVDHLVKLDESRFFKKSRQMNNSKYTARIVRAMGCPSIPAF